LTAETDEAGGIEEGGAADTTTVQPNEEVRPAQAPEVSNVPQPAPAKVGRRRAQLKIVRESIQSLSRDVENFRKSHEASTKKLEAHLASLRKELATHIRSKDLGVHVKSHAAETKRLEKQIAKLRNDLVAFKGQMAREAAKSRAREEAALSGIAAKVKLAKPSKKPRAKSSRKKR
jgi:exonuclease VII large subunit